VLTSVGDDGEAVVDSALRPGQRCLRWRERVAGAGDGCRGRCL